ncbi:MAG: hypothetical protein Q6365_025315, partial [Candidatus Sigynarchaeota archaeon]
EATRFKPDVIGFTSNISYAHKATLTARWLKLHLPSTPVIFGGSKEMQAWLLVSGFQNPYRTFYLSSSRIKKIIKRFQPKNWRMYLNFLNRTLSNMFFNGKMVVTTH